MKLFLCSNFKFLAKKYLPNFFDLNEKHTCLLIGYADESGDFFSERSTKFLESLNFDVIHLSEGYEFNDKIDMVFVKGGNTTQLVHLLRKFNQFEKVRNLVLNGSVFAGQSAGAVLAGIDTEWTLRSEPYEIDVKQELGEYALLGFGFVDKLVFVHCSKLRFPFESEIELAGTENFRVKNTLFYGDYLKDKKLYDKNDYIVLADNQALCQNGDEKKIVTFDWSKLPVMDKNRLY